MLKNNYKNISSLVKTGVSVTPSLAGKQLWLAIFFNIPVWGFVPFVSQAITIICVLIFELSMKYNKDAKEFVNKGKKNFYYVDSWVKWFGWGIIALQFVWIPFLLQFMTLVALGILMFNIKKSK